MEKDIVVGDMREVESDDRVGLERRESELQVEKRKNNIGQKENFRTEHN